MTRCAICGSDLHIYHGQGFSPDLGFCVGHEAVGEVVEVGRGVTQLQVGQSVMLSAAVGCGACGPCLAGDVNQCRNGMAQCYGLSHRLEGYARRSTSRGSRRRVLQRRRHPGGPSA